MTFEIWATLVNTKIVSTSWIGIISSSLVFHLLVKVARHLDIDIRTPRPQRSWYKRNNQTPWQDTQTDFGLFNWTLPDSVSRLYSSLGTLLILRHFIWYIWSHKTGINSLGPVQGGVLSFVIKFKWLVEIWPGYGVSLWAKKAGPELPSLRRLIGILPRLKTPNRENPTRGFLCLAVK